MMKTHYSKWIASLLAIAMIASLAVAPVAAADTGVPKTYTVAASYDTNTGDGTELSEVFREDYPENYNIQGQALMDIGVGLDVTISVNGQVAEVPAKRPVDMSGTLENGTRYLIREDAQHVLTLTLQNGALKDDLNIKVETKAHDYRLTANSGPKGFKSNLGSTSSPTCDIDEGNVGQAQITKTVKGNDSWSFTFKPHDNEVITYLNIRSQIDGQNLVSVNTGSVKVGETEMVIQKKGLEVSVTCQHAADDIYVTALTEARPAMHTITVSTPDGHVSSDVSGGQVQLEMGAEKNILLTPTSGYVVDTISITDGNSSAVLASNKSSVSVNGHTYKALRTLDGKVTLSIPAITADVTISATAANNRAILEVDAGPHMNSNYPAMSYLEKGQSYAVHLVADNDYGIDSVKIESATDYAVLKNDGYGFGYNGFYLDGVYYRIDWFSNNDLNIHLDNLPGNIKISVNAHSYWHTVKMQADGGAQCYDKEIRIEDGGSATVAFFPEGNHTIKELQFSYDGSNSVKADRYDSYINIYDVRCPITWGSDGRVSVTLYNVTSDMTIKALTDYEGRDYAITSRGDNNVRCPSSQYVDRNSSLTLKFQALGNSSISTLSFSWDGHTTTANRGDSSIMVDGASCSLNWTSNGDVSVTLRRITTDIQLYASTTDSGYIPDYRPDTNTPGRYKVGVEADKYAVVNVAYNNHSNKEMATITITPQNGYYLESVYINHNRNARVFLNSATRSVSIDGRTYFVSHYLDGSMRIHDVVLNRDISVSVRCNPGRDPNLNLDEAQVPPADMTHHDFHKAYISGIGGGAFAPAQLTTRGEAVVMLIGAFYGDEGNVVDYYNSHYADVAPGAWYAKYIEKAHNMGLLNGLHTVENTFRPNDYITRAEYTEMIAHFARITTTGTYPVSFYDVPGDYWAKDVIGYAVAHGWASGVGNNMFMPESPISRGEIVCLTNHVLGRTPDKNYINSHLAVLNTFYDVPMTHWGFYDIIEAANDHNFRADSKFEIWS